MTLRSHERRQVNLKLTKAQEEIFRLVVQRLREGGLEYEPRVRRFFSDRRPAPHYMHVEELDRRFGEIDRRLRRLEQTIPTRGRCPASEPMRHSGMVEERRISGSSALLRGDDEPSIPGIRRETAAGKPSAEQTVRATRKHHSANGACR